MIENKTFEKTLTEDEIKEHITVYGNTGVIKLSKIPANSKFVAKITGDIETKYFEQSDSTVYSLPIEYIPYGEDEGVPLKIQVGEGAITRLKEKDPKFIGKMAFFKKTSYNGKFPQFITTFEAKQQSSTKLKGWLSGEKPKENTSTSNTKGIPEELIDWFNTFNERFGKDKFYETFTDAEILEGKKEPTQFLDWITNKETCGTDYVAGIQDDDKRKAKGLVVFWAIVKEYEEN